MSSLISNEDFIKRMSILINGTCEEVLNQEEIQEKWQNLLKECQRLHSDLDKAHRQITSFDNKLYHARKNLDEEKRKRRVVEHYRDLLEKQINMTKDILFHDGETNLDEEIKNKLQFLNKPVVQVKYNNLYVYNVRDDGQLNTIEELNSTGSILSDLNCLSKSEDDLGIDIIIRNQKQQKWNEHKSNYEHFMNKQHGTLNKVAEFNSSERIMSNNAAVKLDDGTNSASFQTAVTSGNINIDPKLLDTKIFANHNFVSKIVIKPETCTSCCKRVGFGKLALKCKNCPVTCHAECKTMLLLPCICRKTM